MSPREEAEKISSAVSSKPVPGKAERAKRQAGPTAVQWAAIGPGLSSALTLQAFTPKLHQARWLLIWCLAAGSLIALMLGALQTPLYKVQASIEVHSPDHTRQRDKPASPDANYQALESFIQTQLRIIESRSLVERVLPRLSDADRARVLAPPRFWWNKTSYEQTLESIRQHIFAKPAEQAGIVDITFSSPDSSAGAHFLNVLTQEFADLNVERTWHAVQRNRQWTQRQIDDLRRKWEQSEQLLSEYSQAASRSSTPSKASKNAAPSRQQVAALQASQEANDTKLRQLRNKLADINSQISQWQTLYGASGSPLKKLRSQAAATEDAIRQRRSVIRQNAAAVAPSYAVIEPITIENDRARFLEHLNALKQEADSNREIFETTSTRLKEASIANASQIADISVIDPAIPVTNSTAPGQFLTGLLGALAGLAFGISWVGLRDHLSRTFKEPAILAHYLRLPVLGAIPVDRFALHPATYDELNQEPALRLNFATDAPTAEAYRYLRSSILLKSSQRSGPRRLVFTSPGTGEGKTSVVGNLGAALASAQLRILLVDGNLRNPGLHKIFGADNNHGLADLLTRQLPDHPVTSRDVIRETQIPELYLLTAGQSGSRAPEVLSSIHLPDLLRDFAKGFDLVLIDSPPLLPYADARSLARAADAVILVVKADYTDRHAALQSRDAVAQDGSPILGTILTDWDAA